MNKVFDDVVVVVVAVVVATKFLEGIGDRVTDHVRILCVVVGGGTVVASVVVVVVVVVLFVVVVVDVGEKASKASTSKST